MLIIPMTGDRHDPSAIAAVCVVMVDKKRIALGPPKEMPAPPEPEAIPTGLAALQACVARLYASSVPHSFLSMSNAAGEFSEYAARELGRRN